MPTAPTFLRKTTYAVAVLIVAVLLTGGFIGWFLIIHVFRRETFPADVLLREHHVTIARYNQGWIAQETSLPPDSPTLGAVDDLLHNEKAQWSSSYVAYVPMILFRADAAKLTVDYHRDKVIVNYANAAGHIRQITRPLGQGEFARISELVDQSMIDALESNKEK